MTTITLDQANAIIDRAFARARELKLKPLTIAVLCPGSHLIAFKRADGASTLRPQIAIGKATGALGMGMNSRAIADIAAERPTFVAALAAIASGGMVPAAGGVLIKDTAGVIIGAVGITGDTSDNDEACAIAAIANIGLVPMR